jgi:hypothetical protein
LALCGFQQHHEVGRGHKPRLDPGLCRQVTQADSDMISYRLPRLILGQMRLTVRCRRRAFRISAGMLNRSVMMTLASAIVIDLPVMSRNS